MKKWLSALILILAVFIIWHLALPAENYVQKIPGEIMNFASSSIPSLKNLKLNISAPPPLRKTTGSSGQQYKPLTNSGVISWTNSQRKINGNLSALTENELLDKSAQKKLADMFKQQYFEHVNPQGKGPADLAADVGYKYIEIGENLALGDFASDQELVTAWMNSPGHRANILNVKFSEIGVAVGQGLYEGHTEWIAVQEFGKPASSCPSVNANLKAEIDSLQAQASVIQSQIVQLKAQIDSQNPQTQSDYDAYNIEVANYNNLIKTYNNKVDFLKNATDEYNTEIRNYNACAA